MKKIINRFSALIADGLRANPFFEKLFVLQGVGISTQRPERLHINSLTDVEFSVFSQWGEDGIIDWLIQNNGVMPETFIEFGVEDFRESNCRFLLKNRNWRGLVMDGDHKNIDRIRADSISWRHDLISICQFIDCENINALIKSSGIVGEIGILSIDIDGNDYWIWKSIDSVKPHLVIIEYNAVFGDLEPISVPYRKDFIRSKANYSNLYYGTSIGALCKLGSEKGYTFLGSNRAGNNAFFIRNDRFHIFEPLILKRVAHPSRFRESLDNSGKLNFIGGVVRSDIIKGLPIVNVVTGEQQTLSQIVSLYSEEWIASMEGR